MINIKNICIVSVSFLCCFISYAGELNVMYSKYLYEVTAKNNVTIYLYGSSHSTVSNIPMHVDQCVKNVFSKADILYIESDELATRLLFSVPQNTVSMRLVKKYIDDETFDLMAEKFFGNQPDRTTTLLSQDALMVLNALTSHIPGSVAILGQTDFGLDVELAMAARFLNKELGYIESPEDQLKFFRLTPPEVYASAIGYIFKLAGNEKESSAFLYKNFSLSRAVADGDEENIVSEMKSDGFNDYDKYTITDRNESITEKILSRLSENKNKTAFIALGAAHLAGEGSVVQLLKAKGYTATRICK